MQLNNLKSVDEYLNEDFTNSDDFLFEEDTMFIVSEDEIFEAGIRRTAKQKAASGLAGSIVKELKKDTQFKSLEEKIKKLAVKLVPKISKDLGVSPAKAKKALSKISIKLKA